MFQGFQKCTIVAQQTGPRISPLGAKFQPPFFALMGMVCPLTYLGTEELVKFGTNPAPTRTFDPKLINFYAEVLHLYMETIG